MPLPPSLVRRKPGVLRPGFVVMRGQWSYDYSMQDYEYTPQWSYGYGMQDYEYTTPLSLL